MTNEQLFLTVDAPQLLLSSVVKVSADVQALVQEIARATDPEAKFEWVVDTISRNSPAVLAIRPVKPSETHSQYAYNAGDMAAEIGTGLQRLLAGERPAHFTDRALEKVRDLTTYRELSTVSFGLEGLQVDMGPDVRGTVDRLLGPAVSSLGAIEGRLESISVHNNRRSFSIYDLLTGQRIICYFGRRITAEKIGAAVERRVSVYGEIRYRSNGSIISVDAQDIEVLQREDELPPPETARGTLSEVVE
jgi:hypothetical protein